MAPSSAGAAAGGDTAGKETTAGVLRMLARLEAEARSRAPRGEVAAAVLTDARRRAADLLEEDPSVRAGAARRFTSDVVNHLWLEARWAPDDLRSLLGGAADIAGVAMPEMALEVLSHPALFQLPPSVAAEMHLRLLLALMPARHVSLWVADARGRAQRESVAGAQRSPAGARAWAERVLARSDAPERPGSRLIVSPVLRWQQPQAVIVADVSPAETSAYHRALLERSAEMLGPVLERQALLAGGARAQHAIMSAADRRLARLGLDLHDGPLQALIRTVHQVEDCRRILEDAVKDQRERERVRGWLDDLDARLLEVEEELREYAGSLGTRGVLQRPVQEMLDELVEEFRAQSEARIVLERTGDFDGMTQSQQIALVRIVQEALNNARIHSGASEVRVSVVATPDHVRATIVDDGCGFDMEQTLVRAASDGRLGLLGMDERVRLLGGTFRIRSQAGAFTELSLTLPRWNGETPVGKNS